MLITEEQKKRVLSVLPDATFNVSAQDLVDDLDMYFIEECIGKDGEPTEKGFEVQRLMDEIALANFD